MFRRTVKPRCGFSAIEVILVVAIIVIVIIIAMPGFTTRKENAKQAEVKANLHNIQLSVERHAVDTEGSYPQYLIGGDLKYAQSVDTTVENAFSDMTEFASFETLSDPLLRNGYLDAYPMNPFVRDGRAIHQMQEKLESSIFGEDPLRNGNETGRLMGTRFGSDCTLMGSVLADPRYPERYAEDTEGNPESKHTWADIEYEFWDMWVNKEPEPFLPGQFFYKGLGPVVMGPSQNSQNLPFIPTEMDQYIMGAYGSVRTKGKDILGPEQPFIYYVNANDPRLNWMTDSTVDQQKDQSSEEESEHENASADESQAKPVRQIEMKGWSYTRSEVSDGHDDLDGSPISINEDDEYEWFQFGNPNGVRDGVILVLSSSVFKNCER